MRRCNGQRWVKMLKACGGCGDILDVPAGNVACRKCAGKGQMMTAGELTRLIETNQGPRKIKAALVRDALLFVIFKLA